jgi:outer membrane protein TolC
VAQALASSTEIKHAEAEKAASAARLQGEHNYWPTISITGQYNVLARFNDYDKFFNKFQRNNLIAGVEIRIPILPSRRSPAVAFAQASLQAAEMQVENKRAEISADVRQKARVAHELQLSREVARLELDLAQQNAQVVQSQFNEGRASLRDAENAQLDQNDKWLAFLDSDFARQQAQLELLQRTGQIAQLGQ